jgi:ribonuclease VapC
MAVMVLDTSALLAVLLNEAEAPEQADIARHAFRNFGRGRHAAGLNYGDCFSYALAHSAGEPLLFKGHDFSQTDVLVVA